MHIYIFVSIYNYIYIYIYVLLYTPTAKVCCLSVFCGPTPRAFRRGACTTPIGGAELLPASLKLALPSSCVYASATKNKKTIS